MSAGFRHQALIYQGDGELLARTVPFVTEGIERGEAVLVAAPERNARLIRAAVPACDTATFTDMQRVARNPARIVAFWREFVGRSLARGQRPRGISEPVWPGRNEVEIDECERHEALLNLAFANGAEWTLLCLYDASALPDEAIDRTATTHPEVRSNGRREESDAYRGVPGPGAAFGGSLPDPPTDAAAVHFTVGDLAAVRNVVSEQALRAGLGLARAADLVAAANELVTNSVRHAGGSGTLRVWSENGDVLCEVRDGGRFTDPLAGRILPGTGETDGRGLWIANQLCDLVQIRSSPRGSATRLRMAQAATE
jgi:anti-sigma regulatory factor (Ser/Thr protein kinase)